MKCCILLRGPVRTNEDSQKVYFKVVTEIVFFSKMTFSFTTWLSLWGGTSWPWPLKSRAEPSWLKARLGSYQNFQLVSLPAVEGTRRGSKTKQADTTRFFLAVFGPRPLERFRRVKCPCLWKVMVKLEFSSKDQAITEMLHIFGSRASLIRLVGIFSCSRPPLLSLPISFPCLFCFAS